MAREAWASQPNGRLGKVLLTTLEGVCGCWYQVSIHHYRFLLGGGEGRGGILFLTFLALWSDTEPSQDRDVLRKDLRPTATLLCCAGVLFTLLLQTRLTFKCEFKQGVDDPVLWCGQNRCNISLITTQDATTQGLPCTHTHTRQYTYMHRIRSLVSSCSPSHVVWVILFSHLHSLLLNLVITKAILVNKISFHSHALHYTTFASHSVFLPEITC